jgi:cysteine desulfuration protein SufE
MEDMQKTQDEIVEEFSRLDDWLDKYEHIVALGRGHEPLEDHLKTSEHAVQGCQSQVWVLSEYQGTTVRFRADSDSLIVKGILALLLRVVNNRPAEQIAAADLYFTDAIGLSTNLSPARANGLATIIRHMQSYASDALSGPSVDRP